MNNRNFAGIIWSVTALMLPLSAVAQVTATVTMGDTTFLNLSTGSTNINGADILYKASNGISYQSNAKGLNLGQIGSASYAALTQAVLTQFASAGSVTPIPPSTLTVGDVFAVEGNTGNFTKAMVTAAAGSSISFTYTTYGASSTGGGGGGGANTPTLTDIVNNSSLTPAGFPNSGVAPSTIFVIHGTNLASATTVSALVDSTKGPLPTTGGLNGAVVTVSAGGKNYTPGLYYAIATQIAGVMPAAVPPGPATVTVSYNGQTSAVLNFTVVASAFGIDVYDGNYGVLQDSVSGAIITPLNSAKPGEPITIWGTAIGSDPGDSDVSYSLKPQAINTQTQVYLGGVLVPQANILYVGSLGYPGVNGIVLNVPSGVPDGCFDSVAVVTGGNVVSNIAVASFMQSGGVCTDSYTGLTGSAIGNVNASGTVNSGDVFVGQVTSPNSSGQETTLDVALAEFQSTTGNSLSSSGLVSVGSCVSTQVLSSGSNATSTPLNAGTVTVTPPGGSAITLQSIPQLAGTYEAQLPAGAVPTSGGTFTFNATGASPGVGPFSATINFPNPILSWTNQNAAATVTRSNGLTYTWSGGASGTYVVVNGSSSSGGVSGSYTCIFPQSAGQGTVPPYITGVLPAGTGTAGIENSTGFTTFKASGLDFGYALGFVSFSVNTTWQ